MRCMTVGRVNYPRVKYAQDLSEAEYQVARDMRTLVIVSDEATMKGVKENIDQSRKNYQEAWDALNKLPISEAGKAILAKVKEARDAALIPNDKVIELGLAKKDDEATPVLIQQAFPANKKVQGLLDEFAQLQDKFINENILKGEDHYKSASFWVFLLVGVAMLLGAVIAFLITRSITRPLGGEPGVISAITDQIAGGDLTVRFTDTGRETGIYAAMREMAAKLKEMVTKVSQATGQVNSAAAEIAQGSADLSQRTEEQASALEETASSMEELTATVKQSAEHAGQANQLASAARNQAEQGGQVVDRAITAMSAINQSSRKIADIIGVIDEIAFQTNLLALNAAVEAARAGEQGRGFAVVAGEVRKLAQRSADAAKEIKALITDSVAKVEDGGKLVDKAGQTLKEIVTSIKKVSDIVAEIAAAAREQATGIEQVNRAILQMDQVTQQNAALVEQTAAASHSMGDQAQELQQLMSFFRLEAGALAAGPAVAHAPKAAAKARSGPGRPKPPARVPRSSSRPPPRSGRCRSRKKPAATAAAAEEWEEF